MSGPLGERPGWHVSVISVEHFNVSLLVYLFLFLPSGLKYTETH